MLLVAITACQPSGQSMAIVWNRVYFNSFFFSKKFDNSNKSSIFVPRDPAKPLSSQCLNRRVAFDYAILYIEKR